MTRRQPATSTVTREQLDAMMRDFRAEARVMIDNAYVASVAATAQTTRELNNVPAPAESE